MSSEHKEELTYASAPEPGQLAEVRRRQWVVSDVQGSYTIETGKPGQIYVTLSSIDEDALGETLEVVWEIEPGAHVIEKAGLPTIDGQDDSEQLEAFLDAVRWGAATNADRNFLQAPFRSGVAVEPFQLDPLVRAIDMARANLLIADDVGLGKTIEAGLVIQELLLRHRARTIFVVCPASLQEKWRVEMLEKFGLEFKIVNSDYIKQLCRDRGIHANPWTSFPRIITSMDWVKTSDPLRLMRDVLPNRTSYPRKFDILVVDEAHNVAPAGSAHYALESLRTRFIRYISPHFQHHLFLTATPHNGYTQSFTSLLELLDNQRFSRNILPDEKQLAQVMVRRLKTSIVDKDNNPIFPTRVLEMLEIPYTEDEYSIHKKLTENCESRSQTSKEVGGQGTFFINSLLKKRLFSSPAAFASTLEKHAETLASGGRKAEAATFDDRILRKAIQKAEEDYADDQKAEEAQDEAIEEASRRVAPLTSEEQVMFNELRNWAQDNRNRSDSKAQAVLDWIEEHLKTDGAWNDKRVIIFTEYRTTHQWLQQILAASDCGADRLHVLHGGMDQKKEREPVKAAFQTDPTESAVRILVATDAASEGIDLQNFCHYMIHLEIPYNPNVMEQRNGRIDRWGQKQKEVFIWHPVDGGARAGETVGGHKDDIIRALQKLEAMRADMGSINPVIAPQMSGLVEGSRKELDTQEAEARAAKNRKYVKVEKDMKDRVAKLHERLEETKHDFHLEPARILKAVATGLALDKRPPLKAVELKNAPSGTVFEMPPLAGTWSRCTEGLPHPHTGKIRPITFDHEVAKGRDDVVLIHLNHRLVQMCLRLLRAEVWNPEGKKKLHRIDIKTLPDSELERPVVAVISRLVITGSDHQRLHEELTVSGGYLGDTRFARESRVTQLDEWLEKATPKHADAGPFEEIKALFDKHEDSILKAVEARSKERLKTLTNTLQIRKQKELDNIQSVLDDLAKAIEEELKKDESPEQFELHFGEYDDRERTQVRRDIEALRARFAELPGEKEQELKIIEKRYVDFTERTFPVAVVFLVPESQLEGASQ